MRLVHHYGVTMINVYQPCLYEVKRRDLSILQLCGLCVGDLWEPQFL